MVSNWSSWTKSQATPLGRGAVLPVTISSFGFKHGLPPEADLVWDVRFLPNPYFQSHLKEKTGKEPDVADFVLNNELGKRFLSLLEPYQFGRMA